MGNCLREYKEIFVTEQYYGNPKHIILGEAYETSKLETSIKEK